MKKFLIISALAVLFPSSMSASEGKKYNGVYTAIGLGAIGLAVYGIYRYRSNPSQQTEPQTNPSLQQPQGEEEKPNLSQLDNQKPSNLEMPSENNNSKTEKALEKKQTNNSKIIPSKPAPQTQPSSSIDKPMIVQPNTGGDTQKQPSFLQELYHRLHQSETEIEAKRLLTDHAFSN